MTHDWIARSAALGAATLALNAALMAAPTASRAADGSGYHLAHTYSVGGDGGWDYLTYDGSNNRVFISRGTRVMVVDAATGSSAGEIPATPGVHGIALAPDLGKGFTSNGRGNSVTVFDLKTLKTTATVAISGQNPDCILYDASSKRVFTFNGRSNDATVIDATTNAVIGTIALPGKPEFAASSGTGMVFVNIEDKNEIVAIDVQAKAIAKTWPISPCDGPSGLSIDTEHHRLFSGCGNKLMAVVDSDSGAVITTLPIGDGVDATAFDPATGLAFSSNGGDGTLTVIHEDSPTHFTVLSNVATQPFARTMAVDSTNHNVYLVTAKIQTGPPAPGETRPTRKVVAGTFALLVVSQ